MSISIQKCFQRFWQGKGPSCLFLFVSFQLTFFDTANSTLNISTRILLFVSCMNFKILSNLEQTKTNRVNCFHLLDEVFFFKKRILPYSFGDNNNYHSAMWRTHIVSPYIVDKMLFRIYLVLCDCRFQTVFPGLG